MPFLDMLLAGAIGAVAGSLLGTFLAYAYHRHAAHRGAAECPVCGEPTYHTDEGWCEWCWDVKERLKGQGPQGD